MEATAASGDPYVPIYISSDEEDGYAQTYFTQSYSPEEIEIQEAILLSLDPYPPCRHPDGRGPPHRPRPPGSPPHGTAWARRPHPGRYSSPACCSRAARELSHWWKQHRPDPSCSVSKNNGIDSMITNGLRNWERKYIS
ncbi:unnamed protein product [Urochloa humidicola]